jgi:hypothetical protein
LELPAVVGQDFAVAGEVVLFKGGGGKGSFRVEEARELRDEGFSLCQKSVMFLALHQASRGDAWRGRTRSRRSFNWDSSLSSSSVGEGGGLVRELNCAYV